MALATLERPTTTTRKPRRPRATKLSHDAYMHLYWIHRNTIWQTANTKKINGVSCLVINTPYTTETAYGLLTGDHQPLCVHENDIDYVKDAACLELARLIQTAQISVENYHLTGCGTWTRITFWNVKFDHE